ncbi:MarR family winged helix-turn-helix transcriptional regulator [Corynebacterium sp. HMSC29G08]|uniref:MarR family winged helix-turn-helix transcriptional regulator n=1 Tax=Corynebacterium sp. HMSC29G08 TaxID=1581069 RepID=UPI0008A1B5BB|nr:MarR family winged helix-turn-helix transcriptional regulator [Corynebacterium sp. HMSC29G08]OFT84942.1 MarR family transcriptional regulator [Corynebacterium sp. HMSC29G08]
MPAEPRWLNEDEQRLWRLMLTASNKISRGMDETLQAMSGLSAPEYAVLVALSESPEMELRLHQLCENLEWDRSRTSHQVTRMAKRGLVEKKRCPGDARGVLVSLTDQGVECLEDAVPGHVDYVRRVVFEPTRDIDRDAVESFLQALVGVPDQENPSESR